MNMLACMLQMLHGLVKRKDMMMNTQLHTEEQSGCILTPQNGGPAMVNSNPISFGALLLYFRAAAGLTQEQPAERAGISPAPIAALERGRRQTPRQTTIELLATALGLDERDREQMLATVRTSVAPPHVSSAVRVDGSTARRLCNQPTPLVGRSQEIDTILRLLAEDGVRLLTLTGVWQRFDQNWAI